MATFKELASAPPEVRRNALRRVAQVLIGAVFIGALLFASAGSFRWPWGCVCIGLLLPTYIAGVILLPLDVIAERGAKAENQESWDKAISVVLAPATFGIYVVAGLDFRWGWSPPLATAWHLAGVAGFVAGIVLTEWALLSNHFFSTAVRLQFERGHTVCTTGPYRCVRHPGYVGMIVFWAATALMLGSLWALVPVAITVGALVVRTALEDRTLTAKLPGYAEYAASVRWRLLPGVW